MKMRSFVFVVPIGAAVVGGGVALGPRIGSLFLSEQEFEPFQYETPLVGGGDIMEPEFEEENPVVYLKVPRQMRVSGTASVTATLEQILPGILLGQEYVELTFAANLTSPAFAIAPTPDPIVRTGRGRLDWDWLITPKQPGEHKLRLEFDQPVISDRSIDKLRRESRLPGSVVMTRSSLVASVSVRTGLGLTATQDALSKAIGGVLALLGIVFGTRFLMEFPQRFGAWWRNRQSGEP